mmetsp:Transcript_1507/g.3329  ORF Transcript_1507/g.3329 Transcript_1507/m.3329 type:complete len:509 (-) Transcript_1507:56-1582(-)
MKRSVNATASGQQDQQDRHCASPFPTRRKSRRNVESLLVSFFSLIALGLSPILLIINTNRAATFIDKNDAKLRPSNLENALPKKTARIGGTTTSLKKGEEKESFHSTAKEQDMESSPRSLSLKDRDPDDFDHDTVLRSLQELTRSPPPGSIVCPSRHFTPIYDKILFSKLGSTAENNTTNSAAVADRKIPRIIHISFNDRCVPNELAESIERWRKALPDHSMFFHDDEAVQRLVIGDDRSNKLPLWHSSEHFPTLRNNMRCVVSKGAMLIDIWRMLVEWTYGGLYTDIDNWPGPDFNAQRTIRAGDSFFTLSDSKQRPTQWLFGMTPRHPIAIFTLQDISRRLLHIKNVARPRVVSITGPQALKIGFRKFRQLLEKNATIFGGSSYFTQVQKIALKESNRYARGSLGGTFDEIVNRFYDESSNITYVNITKREKTQLLSGLKHWTEEVKLQRGKRNMTGRVLANKPKTNTVKINTNDEDPRLLYDGVSCMDYLAALDNSDQRQSGQVR